MTSSSRSFLMRSDSSWLPRKIRRKNALDSTRRKVALHRGKDPRREGLENPKFQSLEEDSIREGSAPKPAAVLADSGYTNQEALKPAGRSTLNESRQWSRSSESSSMCWDFDSFCYKGSPKSMPNGAGLPGVHCEKAVSLERGLIRGSVTIAKSKKSSRLEKRPYGSRGRRW